MKLQCNQITSIRILTISIIFIYTTDDQKLNEICMDGEKQILILPRTLPL